MLQTLAQLALSDFCLRSVNCALCVISLGSIQIPCIFNKDKFIGSLAEKFGDYINIECSLAPPVSCLLERVIC